MPRSARPTRFAALLAAAALGAAGCTPYVEGNGVYYEEERPFSETITGIHVDDRIEATVTAGAAQQKVVVSGDANIVENMRTHVEPDQPSGYVLHVTIETGGGWSTSIPPRVVLAVPELLYAAAEGESHVTASDVAADLFAIDVSERSDVVLTGAGGPRLQVVASDGTVDAGFYKVTTFASVDLSSGARVELNSDGPVTGTVRGGCTLRNLGSGTCAGVFVPAGETATVCEPVP